MTQPPNDYKSISIVLGPILNVADLKLIPYEVSQERLAGIPPEKWYFYTFHALFGTVAHQVTNAIGRQLSRAECLFIGERLEGFIKQYGFLERGGEVRPGEDQLI